MPIRFHGLHEDVERRNKNWLHCWNFPSSLVRYVGMGISVPYRLREVFVARFQHVAVIGKNIEPFAEQIKISDVVLF